MYRIGELAKRFDIKADTLRFYEKHGLLAPLCAPTPVTGFTATGMPSG